MMQTNPHGGIIIICREPLRREQVSKEPASTSLLGNTDSLDVEEYRGFEGIPWPGKPADFLASLKHGLASVDEFDCLNEFESCVRGKPRHDLIYLQGRQPSATPDGFVFRGFDYGFYLAEYSHYSALYYEVLFGSYQNLRHYTKYLNSALLFSSIEPIQDLHAIRDELIADGADLETCDPCFIVPVFGFGQK
jgi:hypothetical protein